MFKIKINNLKNIVFNLLEQKLKQKFFLKFIEYKTFKLKYNIILIIMRYRMNFLISSFKNFNQLIFL